VLTCEVAGQYAQVFRLVAGLTEDGQSRRATYWMRSYSPCTTPIHPWWDHIYNMIGDTDERTR